MGSKIQRINSYEDERFSKDILKEHGAFIVDDKFKCSFKIINIDSAVMYFDKEINAQDLIDEFRFYSEHIINFYNEYMELIKAFPPLKIFDIGIMDIQPSQFFVDRDKVEAIRSFIEKEEDICIPVVKINNNIVSLDGHTRLFFAVKMGYSKVRAYYTGPGDYIDGFVEEARKRGVYSPYDLKLLSHEEYQIKWNKFCDDYFKERA